MSMRKMAVVAAVAALLLTPGCVGKKSFQRSIDDTDGRVVAVESAVEANQKRLTDLKKETDSKLAAVEGKADKALSVGTSAKDAAESAKRLASSASGGKLLWSVALSNDSVKFDFGKAKLSSDAMRALDDMAAKVKGLGKAVYLEIEGHTDNVGSESLNEQLGHKRASAVHEYLSKNAGIPLHAMNVISYGESRPVADNSSRAGRAQNRRVVVRVLE